MWGTRRLARVSSRFANGDGWVGGGAADVAGVVGVAGVAGVADSAGAAGTVAVEREP